MAERGAPKGNKNATKSKPFLAAINRALAARTLKEQRDALDQIADVLIDKCMEGDGTSLKELADRLDGKPAQAIIGDNESDPISITEIVIRAVDGNNTP